MGDFTFNCIFQEVINSSIKTHMNHQVPACQAWCLLTPCKSFCLVPHQIWEPRLLLKPSAHLILPESDSHPRGGCGHVALCISDVVGAPALTHWQFYWASKRKMGNILLSYHKIEVEMISLSSAWENGTLCAGLGCAHTGDTIKAQNVPSLMPVTLSTTAENHNCR